MPPHFCREMRQSWPAVCCSWWDSPPHDIHRVLFVCVRRTTACVMRRSIRPSTWWQRCWSTAHCKSCSSCWRPRPQSPSSAETRSSQVRGCGRVWGRRLWTCFSFSDFFLGGLPLNMYRLATCDLNTCLVPGQVHAGIYLTGAGACVFVIWHQPNLY